MTPEAKNLPASIRNYGVVESYEKEQPLRHDQILLRAIIKPTHLGHRTIKDARNRSTEITHASGKLRKPRLARSNPVAVLTDMSNPEARNTETIRLSASFADWMGGVGVNIDLRDHRVPAGLKRKVVNTRRSGLKITG